MRRSALAGAVLTLAAAAATPARAGAPQPLPLPAAPGAASGLQSPQLRAQVTPNGPAASVPRPATAPTPTPAPARSAPAPAADEVDDELLEFLGSVGDDKDDGGDWLDFLASTDVDKLAKRGAKAPPRGK